MASLGGDVDVLGSVRARAGDRYHRAADLRHRTPAAAATTGTSVSVDRTRSAHPTDPVTDEPDETRFAESLHRTERTEPEPDRSHELDGSAPDHLTDGDPFAGLAIV
jgi:hypothetical protein